jgi:hypothetical protein
MIITQIICYDEDLTRNYPDYDQMIQEKREYWEITNQDTAKRFKLHHELIQASEESLERLYGFEKGQLKGAQLIYGSIRDMREALADEQLREKIRNDQVTFVIKIGTRYVGSEMTDYTLLTSRIIATYQIRHNFYGIATIEDPVVSP